MVKGKKAKQVRRRTSAKSRLAAPKRRSSAAAAATKSIAAFTSGHHDDEGAGHAPKPPVEQDPSPNFASRQGEIIQTLVLHNTDGPLTSSLKRLKDPAAQVSAHYVVDRTGTIYQLVDDSNTAWHSGNKAVNQRSIGIEVVAWKSATGMTATQEQSLINLCKFVLGAYDVPLEQVVPHRSIKATACPGWLWDTDAELKDWKTNNLR